MCLLVVQVKAQISQDSVVNKYAAVLGYDVCDNSFTVDTATGFAVGDTVLIIQMKGAIIDSSNSSNFGTVVNYRGAGNHELNTIGSITGNQITLNSQLQRSYDIPDGYVQLVRVPSAQNHTVNSKLTCKYWTAGKGGVTVMWVHNTLTLNADIDVSAKGFRGSGFIGITGHTCNQTNYYYHPNTNLGAYKGEGITSVSISRQAGRGALANGGGGGNSHNSGGGGGANVGAGGLGGDQYRLTAVCPNIILVVGGVGGRALNYSLTPDRLFMGGGGGGGHTNEVTDKPGGSGGGIVILIANTLNGNGKNIISDGGNVYECSGATVGCANDGHSGGGAGGAIALAVDNFNGTLNTSAKGGKGADAWVFSSTIGTTGPGAGGGGGLVWYKPSSTPGANTHTLTGGANGISPLRGNINWNAQPGQPGAVKNNYAVTYPGGAFVPQVFYTGFEDSIGFCLDVYFSDTSRVGTGSIASRRWHFGDGGTSTLINPTHQYASSGTYTVKLVITDDKGCADSITRNITVAPQSLPVGFMDSFTYCNTVFFTDTTSVSLSTISSWRWSFGDGATSTQQHPQHSYSGAGPYSVKLVVNYTAGCTDSTTRNVTAPFIPFADAGNDTGICLGKSIQIFATGGVSYSWLPTTYLDDPSSSSPKSSPQDTIDYTVTVTHAMGCTDKDTVRVNLLPGSELTVTPPEDSVCRGAQVKLKVTGAKTYSWIPANSMDNPTSSTPTATVRGSGSWIVLAIDSAGCQSTDSAVIGVYPPFGVLATANPPGFTCKNNEINLSATGAVDYIWHPGDLFRDSTDNRQTVNVWEETLFYVDGISEHGCVNRDSIVVGPDLDIVIFMPNAFTPNGDGANDKIKPLLICDFELDEYHVYNRYGQQVFFTKTKGEGWDGTFKGKLQKSATFFYMILGRNHLGDRVMVKGDFTLLL